MPTDEMDPLGRFSQTATHYARYRPGYPPELLVFTREKLGLTPDEAIADVGSGAGQLARLFLENGNVVYGVEPNEEMRRAGEVQLQGFPHFKSIAGRAEATGLPADSVDLVAAGTAFHWFEVSAARREFQRILKPGGWVLLAWNLWHREPAPFNRAYRDFLADYSTDYAEATRRWEDESRIRNFFGGSPYREVAFHHEQSLDWAGVWGRYRSTSYALPAGHARFSAAERALRQVFEEKRSGGRVAFHFQTLVYYGRLMVCNKNFC